MITADEKYTMVSFRRNIEIFKIVHTVKRYRFQLIIEKETLDIGSPAIRKQIGTKRNEIRRD